MSDMIDVIEYCDTCPDCTAAMVDVQWDETAQAVELLCIECGCRIWEPFYWNVRPE